MQKISLNDVDSYLALVPEKMQLLLQKLRQTIRKAAPDAEETISYGMPAYRCHGVLVYFAAFKNHCSFFPASGTLINEMKNELKGFKTSKGTIQFTVEKPLPASLVTKMVKARVRQNLEKEKEKAKKKSK
jgi:uncharacterized protein YdhG (YjbR/CyaY superfamily)